MRKLCGLAFAVVGTVLLGGCEYKPVPDPKLSARDQDFISQVPKANMGANFERYQVEDPTGQAPGTVGSLTGFNRQYRFEVHTDTTIEQFATALQDPAFAR